jgi:hypothetical protein
VKPIQAYFFTGDSSAGFSPVNVFSLEPVQLAGGFSADGCSGADGCSSADDCSGVDGWFFSPVHVFLQELVQLVSSQELVLYHGQPTLSLG